MDVGAEAERTNKSKKTGLLACSLLVVAAFVLVALWFTGPEESQGPQNSQSPLNSQPDEDDPSRREQDLLLLIKSPDVDSLSDEQREYFIVEPGETPSRSNQIDVPPNFYGNFTDDGGYLVGSADSVGYSVDTSSYEVSEIKQFQGSSAVFALGKKLLARETTAESTTWHIADQSDPTAWSKLRDGTEFGISTRGNYFTIGTDTRRTIFDVETGEELLSFDAVRITFSPDEKFVLATSPTQNSIFEVATGQLVVREPAVSIVMDGAKWNMTGTAVLVYQAPFIQMLTTDGAVVDLGRFDSASFVSDTSLDLQLTKPFQTPSYYDAESNSIVHEKDFAGTKPTQIVRVAELNSESTSDMRRTARFDLSTPRPHEGDLLLVEGGDLYLNSVGRNSQLLSDLGEFELKQAVKFDATLYVNLRSSEESKLVAITEEGATEILISPGQSNFVLGANKVIYSAKKFPFNNSAIDPVNFLYLVDGTEVSELGTVPGSNPHPHFHFGAEDLYFNSYKGGEIYRVPTSGEPMEVMVEDDFVIWRVYAGSN